MLKTVKVKKQLRLDELIKYVWDNHLYPETFKSNFNDFAHFDKTGKYQLIDQRGINQATKFTVEVEEEINNTTIFKSVVGVLNNDEIMLTNMHTTIEGIQDKYGSMKEIHAVIDGKLQLIWEAKD